MTSILNSGPARIGVFSAGKSVTPCFSSAQRCRADRGLQAGFSGRGPTVNNVFQTSRKTQSPRYVRTHVSSEFSASSSNDFGLSDFIEVKVESVKQSSTASVVCLRLIPDGRILPVHIGEAECLALQKELNKTRQARPATHDLTKNLLASVGTTITKVRIVDLVNNTYYARIHLTRDGLTEEKDVDARPSDAINLAVRFGAPIFVNKRVAERALQHVSEMSAPPSESHAEIIRSVREALANFEDPTVFHQLAKEVAIQEQRFSDAATLQAAIYREMTGNRAMRLVVAMESALNDMRYEEAAKLRDELKQVQLAGDSRPAAAAEMK